MRPKDTRSPIDPDARSGARSSASPAVTTVHALACMEIRGGNQAVHEALELPGLDVWVHSMPFADDAQGGDVHSLSSCGTGRISRLVLADVSGHGLEVAVFARRLRRLMGRFMNYLDQTRFVEELNRRLAVSESGRFATSLTMTYFAPNRRLDLCNAGHPRPLLFRAQSRTWSILTMEERDIPRTTSGPATRSTTAPSDTSVGRRDPADVTNLPLGVLEPTRYEEFGVRLEPGDLLLAYTDAVIESRGADGTMLGETGLLGLVESLGRAGQVRSSPESLIDRLLAALDDRQQGTPSDDDLTILVLRCNAASTTRGFFARAWAGARFLGIVARNLVPLGEPPPIPWPERSVPNLLGPFSRRAAESWKGPKRVRE